MTNADLVLAFDNLGPAKFAELCGALLASRYPIGSVALAGVGGDAGADAQVDERFFRVLQPKNPAVPGAPRLPRGQRVIFQFKHIDVTNKGESKARTTLLQYYQCNAGEKCELHQESHARLLNDYKPVAYRLITNVEVSRPLRLRFMARCRADGPQPSHKPYDFIQDYDVLGLEDLKSWLATQPDVAQQFLRALYGPVPFALGVDLERVYTYTRVAQGDMGPRVISAVGVRPRDLPAGGGDGRVRELCRVTVRNLGTQDSYIDRLEVHVHWPGETRVWTKSADSEEVLVRAHDGRQYYLDLSKVADGGTPDGGTPDGGTPDGLVRVVDRTGEKYDTRMPADMLDRIVAPERYRIECVNDGKEYTNPPPGFRVFRYDYGNVAHR